MNHSDSEGQAMVKGILFSAVGTLLALWLASRLLFSRLATSALVNPNAVKDIAATLPLDEDEFILAAWDYVSKHVRYEGFASEMFFSEGDIQCHDCYLPAHTLQVGVGNCVSMASALASLLRYGLPAERLYMAIGTLSLDGTGGHGWVEVQRSDGVWYVLEATHGPTQPWVPVSMAPQYDSMVLFNDQEYVCYSPEICKLSIGPQCECLLREGRKHEPLSLQPSTY